MIKIWMGKILFLTGFYGIIILVALSLSSGVVVGWFSVSYPENFREYKQYIHYNFSQRLMQRIN